MACKKNIFLCFSFALFLQSIFVLPVFAQDNAATVHDEMQTVFPKRIFVGDEAEIHYLFNSNIDFFPSEENIDEKPLLISNLPFETDNKEFTLKKCVLQKNGLMYSLVLTFTAWKPGELDFPPFELVKVVFGTEPSVPCVVDPKPVTISSVLPKGSDSSFRRASGPLLLPGTLYCIYGLLICFLVLLTIIIRIILQWENIRRHFSEISTRRKYKKNARSAIKKFKKLLKNSSTVRDGEFCRSIQKIFRSYLTVRFGENFLTVTSSCLNSVFQKIFSGLMNDSAQENVERLFALFKRCDYVRFARGSIDSKRLPEKEFAALLQENERSSLIENAILIVKTFESDNGDINNA